MSEKNSRRITITIDEDDHCTVSATADMQLDEIIDILNSAVNATADKAKEEANQTWSADYRDALEQAKKLLPQIYGGGKSYKN